MIVELSHKIEHGMITYQGLPAPVISEFLTREASRANYAPGTEFSIGRIELVANTGTYVDTPFHRYADGADLAEVVIESLADLEGVVVHAPEGRRITAEALAGASLRRRAVLFHTGWDRHWRTEQYFEGHPFLTCDAAEALVDGGAQFVGIDSYNVDDTADLARPAHTLLLGAGIPICEHMTNLDALPLAAFRFFAVPPKIRGLGSFPVRAFAVTGA